MGNKCVFTKEKKPKTLLNGFQEPVAEIVLTVPEAEEWSFNKLQTKGSFAAGKMSEILAFVMKCVKVCGVSTVTSAVMFTAPQKTKSPLTGLVGGSGIV